MRIPYLYEFFEYIGQNSILGIPMDIPAHLIVGSICAMVILKTTKNYKVCLLSILMIALTKELYDQQIMTNTLQENIKDIIVTMIPAFLIIYLHQIRIDQQA